MKEHYGDDYDMEKEDCIGHIQKRLGTNLRAYKKKLRGVKLKDGESVGGRGRLTDAIIDKMQTCYGYAIRNNIGNKENIRNAIFAIFYHMVLGPSYESPSAQHKYCPLGSGSRCKYQLDISSNTNKYDRTKCLPFIFRGELLPILNRLSSDKVFSQCQRDLTQNQNESLNNVVWSKCPKRVFCGKSRLTISVCEAVTYYEGAVSRLNLLQLLKMNSSINTKSGLEKQNTTRVRHAQKKLSAKFLENRQKVGTFS